MIQENPNREPTSLSEQTVGQTLSIMQNYRVSFPIIQASARSH